MNELLNEKNYNVLRIETKLTVYFDTNYVDIQIDDRMHI